MFNIVKTTTITIIIIITHKPKLIVNNKVLMYVKLVGTH